MSRDNDLPFPRGQTYWNGDTTQITSGQGSHFEGQTFTVKNDLTGSPASGLATARTANNEEIELRIVRNSTAIRLGGTATSLLRYRGVKFGTGANQHGRQVASYCQGAHPYIGMPMDDAYVSSVAVNDLFYVIQKGPATVRFGTWALGAAATAATAVPQFCSVAWTTGGFGCKAKASKANFGSVDSVVTARSTATAGVVIKVVHVGGIFAAGELVP